MKRQLFGGARFLCCAFLGAAMLLGAGASADSRRAKAAEPIVVAQLGLGNVLGAGKDFAVKQALSSFGKSIGADLPIVVDPGDAYPTVVALGGAPFAPGIAPSIAGLLRASSDGTIALPPGDFEFPVGVFCMQAHAGSPAAHRYLVAPLHGSAADIVTALNSRIPSYSIDHHVLQVLSWDIQAGMAYGAMQSAQRSAVDRIIPDYRSRLDGDVYERIRDRYTQAAQNVPGMPSFEEALERTGPVGAQVVALQNLRQELAQPPPTFSQLAHSLVPELPTTTARNVTGDTPWSRYSDRVFVRFTTIGNYATPGTYQVRVLPQANAAQVRRVSGPVSFASYPEPPLLGAANFAAVPFTNIVNNPGTGAVQPLTQTPLGPPQSPPPSPAPSPAIISQTVATLPADRGRRLVGVGEQVKLTFSAGNARWSISGLDGSISPASGISTLYKAASTAAKETITARGAHGEATIAFDVIAPSGVVVKRLDNVPDLHHNGRPDSGFQMHTFITPDTVSFQFIRVKELEDGGVGTGIYRALTGGGHGPYPEALPVGHVVAGYGSVEQSVDTATSGDDCRMSAPFEPGKLVYKIPVVYQVGINGAFHPLTTVQQTSELLVDGVSLETTKATAFVTGKVSDPTFWVGKPKDCQHLPALPAPHKKK